MKEIWLIRHAESAANAGAVTSSPETIPLTEKGLQQARRVAAWFDKQPDIIAVSRYVVITHGQFIKAMMWLWWHKVEHNERESMSAFRAFMQGIGVPNAAIVKIRLMPNEDELYFSGVNTSHLSSNLI